MRRVLVMITCFICGLVSIEAYSEERFSNALEISLGAEQLSGSYSNWQVAGLQYEHQLNTDALVYARWQQTKRFSLNDQELSLGGYYSFSQQWQTHVELSHSPSNRVRPFTSAHIWLSRSLTQGFIASMGYHRTDWQPTISHGYSGRIERYVGAWRWAYTLRSDVLNGASGNTLSHQLSLSHYYGDSNHISLGVFTGDELEKISPTDIVITAVKGVSVYGLHYTSTNWGWRWSLGFNQQGNYYDRLGMQIGLRYRF